MSNYADGNPEAIATYSGQLKAPPVPTSLGRLGTAPNLTGLFEGIAMSLLDTASTAELAGLITKVTEDLVTDSTTVKAIGASYSAADAAAALGLAGSTVKLAKQGLDLVQQLTGTQTSSDMGTGGAASANSGTDTPVPDEPVGDSPQATV
jgi:hypothetical protein